MATTTDPRHPRPTTVGTVLHRAVAGLLSLAALVVVGIVLYAALAERLLPVLPVDPALLRQRLAVVAELAAAAGQATGLL